MQIDHSGAVPRMTVPGNVGVIPAFTESEQARQAQDGQEPADLGTTIRTLRRSKLLLFLITAVLTIAATAVILRLSPVYRAGAVVLTNHKLPSMLEVTSRGASITPDNSAIESDVQILSSQSLAQQVIDSLGLAEDPEFNFSLRPREPSLLDGAMAAVGLKASGNEAPSPDVQAVHILNAFQSKLAVEPIGRSLAIRITFTSRSPETAAKVPNTLAALYIQRQINERTAAHKAAVDWLTAQLATTERQMEQAQRNLRNAKNVTFYEGAPATEEVLGSPLIQDLRKQEAAARQQLAAMEAKYGIAHPDVTAAASQLKSIRRTINREIAKIREQLTGNAGKLDPGQDDDGQSRSSPKLHKQPSGEQGIHERLSLLERQAAVEDTVYRNLLAQSKEIGMQSGVDFATSEIISRAEIPTHPFFPNKKLLILLSLFISGMVATVTVLILDNEGRTIITHRQAESLLGVEAIGFVPLLSRMRGQIDTKSIERSQSQSALFHGSISNLYVKLKLARGRPPKKLMIVSSAPREGKTFVSLALALYGASSGRRTVIVDCDLRRPRVHTALKLSEGPGLSEYLSGKATLDQIIRKPAAEGPSVVTAGGFSPHPADLFSTDCMTELLDILSDRFDMVIVDAPPVGPVWDALILAPQMDSVLLLVRWGKTRRQIITRAARHLLAAGANLSGVVLSMVDLKRVVREEADDYYDAGAHAYFRR